MKKLLIIVSFLMLGSAAYAQIGEHCGVAKPPPGSCPPGQEVRCVNDVWTCVGKGKKECPTQPVQTCSTGWECKDGKWMCKGCVGEPPQVACPVGQSYVCRGHIWVCK